jgi:uncharacterized cupin superfamily protein
MNGLRNLIVAASLFALAGCGGSAPEVNGNQEATGNQTQVNEAKPSSETAAVENEAAAENAAAPATSNTLDRTFLVGRWSETGDCADATEFRADGSFVFPWGTGGTWQFEGDPPHAEHQHRLYAPHRISQDQLDAVSPGGSVHHNKRC